MARKDVAIPDVFVDGWLEKGIRLPSPHGHRPTFVAPRTLERLVDGVFMWGNPVLGEQVAYALVAAGLAEVVGTRGMRATSVLTEAYRSVRD